MNNLNYNFCMTLDILLSDLYNKMRERYTSAKFTNKPIHILWVIMIDKKFTY